MMEKRPQILNRSDWSDGEDFWQGEFEGRTFGTNASVMFYTVNEVGKGTGLHKHPYDEIFIMRKGNALFTIGDQEIRASEGQILFGPANIPHKYINLGPGPLETTDIHVADVFIQEDLD